MTAGGIGIHCPRNVPDRVAQDTSNMTQRVRGRRMRRSAILEQDREELVRRCRRMTPEERLVAHVNLSRLMSQIHQAGVKYRLRRRAPLHVTH